ncbi:MAG TPA: ribosomal protein S18-alanine N-acetyltransferase [Dissulfurispiraceae bacterium]|nr:ribosomal protein S18-alanine N-acetyltransferase [Dissulfurispiraceae bacterium]
MNSVSLRDMRPEDVPDVAEIERSSFSTPWSEHSIYSEVYGKYSIARVAVLDDRIVGYVMARLILEEGHLMDLAVHPAFRARGIAKMLMEDVIKGLHFNRCRVFFLEVRASNDTALKLYADIGFNVVGTRKNYYKDPVEDAFVMMLDINAKVV